MTDKQYFAMLKRIKDPKALLKEIIESEHMLGDLYYREFHAAFVSQARVILGEEKP
jgi:hypothetical protein